MQKMSSNHVKRHWMTDFVSVNYLNWMCLVTMGFENSDLLAYMIKKSLPMGTRLQVKIIL